LARGSEPVVAQLGGRIEFTDVAASTDAVTGQLLGAPLRFSFSIEDFAAPSVSGALATRVDLGRAAALDLFPVGWTAAGAPDIDLTVSGSVQQPSSLVIDGQISLAGLSLDASNLPAPVSISAGTLEFGGDMLLGRGLAT